MQPAPSVRTRLLLQLGGGALALLAAAWVFGVIAHDVVSGPPLTVRNTRKSRCVPVMEIGNVWVAQVPVPPVARIVLVCRIGPLTGSSWWISTAPMVVPAVRPAAASETR